MSKEREMNIDPNMWIEIGNGFSACIKQSPDGKWEVWVLTDDDDQFISASNLPTEQDAAANLTGVVTRTYGDERIYTAIEMPLPRTRRARSLAQKDSPDV